MQFLANLSIRNKILGSFGLVLISLVFLGYFSINHLSHVKATVHTIVDEAVPTTIDALQIQTELSSSLNTLGVYLLNKDEKSKQTYLTSIEKSKALLNKLLTYPDVKNDPNSIALLEKTRKNLLKLDGIQQQLFEFANSDSKNFPAIKYAADTVNIAYREKLQLLSSMIQSELDEDADDSRKNIMSDVIALRYAWTNINNEFRLFLASRTPNAIDNLKSHQEIITQKMDAIAEYGDLLTFEQADAIEQFENELNTFWGNIDKVVELHSSEEWRQDAFFLRTVVSPLKAEINQDLDKLINIRQEKINTGLIDTDTTYTDSKSSTRWMIAVIFALISLVAWLLSRGITRPLDQAVALSQSIADGDLNNNIHIKQQDETGKLLLAFQSMQSDLRERAEKDAVLMAENMRIKLALDNSGTATTVSNSDNILIYMNKAVTDLFSDMSSDWQESFSDFSVNNLLGNSLSKFLNDKTLIEAYTTNLEETKSLEGIIAGRNIQLDIRPVYDDQNNYLGRVTQWTDRTQEILNLKLKEVQLQEERKIAAENERIKVSLDNVSSNVMLTDTDDKIIYLNKAASKLFCDNAEIIKKSTVNFDENNLIGHSVHDIHRDINGIMRNESTQTSDLIMDGLFLKLTKNTVNDDDNNPIGHAIEWENRTQQVAIEKEIDSLVEAASNGNLNTRIQTTNKSGFFLQLSQGFNQLLEQLSNVFDDIGDVMQSMSQGDMTKNIPSKYNGTFGDITSDINNTCLKLDGTISQLRTIVNAVDAASAEINSGNTNLSGRTEQQAASLEETASSMEEITSTVKHNADNAQQANLVAESTQQKAMAGGAVVNKAIEAMAEINHSSNKISEIIGVIDEIAFQTNLLALNASVEAARAGEQGRGFAVVATEVRNLASRSADAAKEIKELIQDSSKKVAAGSDLVNETGGNLEEIVSGVKQVGGIIAEIAAASREQTEGIEQINRSITEMDNMTQQNASLAEQTSAASSAMTESARNMQQSMAFFQVSSNSNVVDIAPTAKAQPKVTSPSISKATPQNTSTTIEKFASSMPEKATSNDEWEEF